MAGKDWDANQRLASVIFGGLKLASVIAGLVEHRLSDYLQSYYSDPLLPNVLSFIVRTVNSYWGTQQWVDLARFTGLQPRKDRVTTDKASESMDAPLLECSPSNATTVAKTVISQEASVHMDFRTMIYALFVYYRGQISIEKLGKKVQQIDQRPHDGQQPPPCVACVLPCGAFDVVRVVHINGHVDEYSHQVTAGEILAAHPATSSAGRPPSPGTAPNRMLIVSPISASGAVTSTSSSQPAPLPGEQAEADGLRRGKA
ncbi:hypothetical protein HPP92_019195 [Vanilla planifolia]|uniref:Uncharacterized protein n=1 Tax=Vanilla planifolia TaxID=51239 RepID=A0A835Q6H1_VANPL|nr:hypothetical protein HPP92_019195 [Vanilla planifolia]